MAAVTAFILLCSINALVESTGKVELLEQNKIVQESSSWIITFTRAVQIYRILIKGSVSCDDFSSSEVRIGGQFSESHLQDWKQRNHLCQHICEQSYIPGYSLDLHCNDGVTVGRILTMENVPSVIRKTVKILVQEVKGLPRSSVEIPKPIAIQPSDTWQSSVQDSFDSGNAVDSDIEIYSKTDATMVKPWWAASLGKEYVVTSVVVTVRNTPDVNCDKLTDIEVRVGNTTPTASSDTWILENQLCHSDKVQSDVCDGSAYEFTCNQPPPIGQYVSIQSMNNEQQSLTMAHVKVYGSQVDDLQLVSTSSAKSISLLPSMAEQSSTYIVDGNPAADLALTLWGFTHTNQESFPWWKVTLSQSHMLSKVILKQRPCDEGSIEGLVYRFRNVEVRVGNHASDANDKRWPYKNALCSTIRGISTGCIPPDNDHVFTCNQFPPPIGKHVSVQIVDDSILEIQLIEVFGYPVDLEEEYNSKLNTMQAALSELTYDDGIRFKPGLIHEAETQEFLLSSLVVSSEMLCAFQCLQNRLCVAMKWKPENSTVNCLLYENLVQSTNETNVAKPNGFISSRHDPYAKVYSVLF